MMFIVPYFIEEKKEAVVDGGSMDEEYEQWLASQIQNSRYDEPPVDELIEMMNQVPIPEDDEGGERRLGGGRHGRRWIMSQGPMQTTIQDFWSMVWHEETNAIVMLTKTFECIAVMCAQYWPVTVGAREKYGDISVLLVKEEVYAHYKVTNTHLVQWKTVIGIDIVHSYCRYPSSSCARETMKKSSSTFTT